MRLAAAVGHWIDRQPRGHVYTVQLHRATPEDEDDWYGPVKILNSWAPIRVRGLRAARSWAHRLRMDNAWGGPTDWPHVTITDADGRCISEREASS